MGWGWSPDPRVLPQRCHHTGGTQDRYGHLAALGFLINKTRRMDGMAQLLRDPRTGCAESLHLLSTRVCFCYHNTDRITDTTEAQGPPPPKKGNCSFLYVLENYFMKSQTCLMAAWSLQPAPAGLRCPEPPYPYVSS